MGMPLLHAYTIFHARLPEVNFKIKWDSEKGQRFPNSAQMQQKETALSGMFNPV